MDTDISNTLSLVYFLADEESSYFNNDYQDFKRISPIEKYQPTEWPYSRSPHRERNIKLENPYQKNPFNDNERRVSTPTTRDRRQLGEVLLNVIEKVLMRIAS